MFFQKAINTISIYKSCKTTPSPLYLAERLERKPQSLTILYQKWFCHIRQTYFHFRQ